MATMTMARLQNREGQSIVSRMVLASPLGSDSDPAPNAAFAYRSRFAGSITMDKTVDTAVIVTLNARSALSLLSLNDDNNYWVRMATCNPESHTSFLAHLHHQLL